MIPHLIIIALQMKHVAVSVVDIQTIGQTDGTTLVHVLRVNLYTRSVI